VEQTREEREKKGKVGKREGEYETEGRDIGGETYKRLRGRDRGGDRDKETIGKKQWGTDRGGETEGRV
jgi:hypothetical protein